MKCQDSHKIANKCLRRKSATKHMRRSKKQTSSLICLTHRCNHENFVLVEIEIIVLIDKHKKWTEIYPVPNTKFTLRHMGNH
jgi:hypothetical protein